MTLEESRGQVLWLLWLLSSSIPQLCIIFLIRAASSGLARSRWMKTGQPSRRKFCVAAASSDKYRDIVASSVPKDEPGNCLRMSSTVNLIGITQDLYQGHSLHCTTAAASSSISLIVYSINNLLVAHRGFEPLISALRGRCPGPLDECAILAPQEGFTVLTDYIL